MAGPNLEIFKFGLYLFFPLALMIQFGSPDWYRKNVTPYKDSIFPKESATYKPPHTRTGVITELERLKAQRILRKERSQLETSKDATKAAGRLV